MASALFLIYQSEQVTTVIENHSDLKGEVERGWLNSEHIPKSAFEIKITKDIDTNEVKLSFNFDPKEMASLKQNCNVTSSSNSQYTYQCEYKCQWCKKPQTVIVNLNQTGKGNYHAW